MKNQFRTSLATALMGWHYLVLGVVITSLAGLFAVAQAQQVSGTRPAKQTGHERNLGVLKPSSRKIWPRFAHSLFGYNRLTFDNHTDSDVWVGLRNGSSGYDLRVTAQGKGYFSLPAGSFQTYVFRFDRPAVLFEAGSITIAESGGRPSVQTVCLWIEEEQSP